MDNRQAAVDVLKGWAIVGVVLHHVRNRRFDAEVQANLLVVMQVAACAVYAFLFGSGFLQALSRRTEAAGVFIVRRAHRLLVPYLWLGVLYAGVFQFDPGPWVGGLRPGADCAGIGGEGEKSVAA